MKVRRPSDSMILLVVCPALYCSYLLVLPFTCPVLPLTCPVLPFAAFYSSLLPFSVLYCFELPFICPFSIRMGQWVSKRTSGYRLGYRLPSHIPHGKIRHTCRSSTDMSQQMIFVDRIAFGGALSLSKDIGKIRHSTVTLLLTTITEVLTACNVP